MSWYFDVHFPIHYLLLPFKSFVMTLPVGILDLYFSDVKRLPLRVVSRALIWCIIFYVRYAMTDFIFNGKVEERVVTSFSFEIFVVEVVRYVFALVGTGMFAWLCVWYHKAHILKSFFANFSTTLDAFFFPFYISVGATAYVYLLSFFGLEKEAFDSITLYFMNFHVLFMYSHDPQCASILPPIPNALNVLFHHNAYDESSKKNVDLTRPIDIYWDFSLGVNASRRRENAMCLNAVKYVSLLKDDCDVSDLFAQTELFGKSNRILDITGVMYVNVQTREVLQLLEGPELNIKALYARIKKDDRHVIMHSTFMNIKERNYSSWGMMAQYFPAPSKTRDANSIWKHYSSLTNMQILDFDRKLLDFSRGMFIATMNHNGKCLSWRLPDQIHVGVSPCHRLHIMLPHDEKSLEATVDFGRIQPITISKIPFWVDNLCAMNEAKMGSIYDLTLAGFHFESIEHNDVIYASVYPAERNWFCCCEEVSFNGMDCDLLAFDVRAVGIMETVDSSTQMRAEHIITVDPAKLD